MSSESRIRAFDYVNHPYDVVSRVLWNEPLAVFQRATKVASTRAAALVAELHVDLKGLKLASDIAIRVEGITERDAPGFRGNAPATFIELEWEAASHAYLFPIMRAELGVYALSSTETQLDFSGVYEPPLGNVGLLINAVAGHRLAESAVHGFVSEVAAHLRRALAKP